MGRVSAGANFYDMFGEVMEQLPGGGVERGVVEPCAYLEKNSGAVLTHHIDDGRLLAATLGVSNMIPGHSKKHVIMKVGEPIEDCMCESYLRRLKIRG